MKSVFRARNTKNHDPYGFLNAKNPQQILAVNHGEDLQKSRRHLTIAGSVILSVLVLTFLGAVLHFKYGVFQDKNTYAYFEIKAIDANGRTVVGSKVTLNDETVGVTDSFGEWRRYLDVKLGQKVTFKFFKKNQYATWTGSQTIKVPSSKPLKGDLEIFSKVKMKLTSKSKTIVNRKSATRQTSTLVKTLPAAHINVGARMSGNHDSKTKKHISYAHTKNQVLPFVNKFLKRKKTAIPTQCDSLLATFIPHQNKRGYIEMNCQNSRGVSLWSVLRNMEPSRRTTATKIFKAMQDVARVHGTNKSPVRGWRSFRFATLGGEDTGDVKMFVSGYPVKKMKDGTFRYFGQPKGRVNLAVISDGQMVYRTRLTNGGNQMRYISLPNSKIARR